MHIFNKIFLVVYLICVLSAFIYWMQNQKLTSRIDIKYYLSIFESLQIPQLSFQQVCVFIFSASNEYLKREISTFYILAVKRVIYSEL